ncbi:MAG: hypothetical protein JW836_15155 [Deltaproteobacteria bacterium]|nr:hypothetical protein [Deltaproteobacteria bacterium]
MPIRPVWTMRNEITLLKSPIYRALNNPSNYNRLGGADDLNDPFEYQR